MGQVREHVCISASLQICIASACRALLIEGASRYCPLPHHRRLQLPSNTARHPAPRATLHTAPRTQRSRNSLVPGMRERLPALAKTFCDLYFASDTPIASLELIQRQFPRIHKYAPCPPKLTYLT